MGEIWIPLSASSSTSQRASASSSDGPATASGLQLRGHVEAIARIVLVYSVIAVLTEAPNSRECLKIAPHSSSLYRIMTQPQCGRLEDSSSPGIWTVSRTWAGHAGCAATARARYWY